MEARVVDDPDEVSLVVTATTSQEPILPEEIQDNIFVAAVGAFDPEMAEPIAGKEHGCFYSRSSSLC
jgi:ornithine cyclodeaminase/alanine dehydrogenase-like protein (mu-crystallin family)